MVLATPGPMHEKQLLACLEHRKPVLCEKPLTTDVATSLEVVKREAELGKRLIQVGFMRRFDPEYMQLKALIDGGELGRAAGDALRAPQPRSAAGLRLARWSCKDSLVHEVDVTRFLFGEEIASVQIIKPAANPAAPTGLAGPTDRGLPDRVGQARRRRGVRHHRRGLRGAHRGGRREGQRNNRSGCRPGTQDGARALGVAGSPPGSGNGSARAYDIEVQRWVDAVRRRCATGDYTDGPTAWDGYAAAAVCAAGVRSLRPVSPSR